MTHLGLSPPSSGRSWPTAPTRSAATTCSSLRVLGSTGEPWNPEPWWWFFREVGEGRLPDHQLQRRHRGQRRHRVLQPADADQADLVRRPQRRGRGGRRRRGGTAGARQGRRAGHPPAAAGHDARLLERPGALPGDVLVARPRRLGARRLGAGRRGRLLVHPGPLRTTRSRSPASASGRPRSRAPPWPTRPCSRRRPSACPTRSRARSSWSSACCAGARPTTPSCGPRSRRRWSTRWARRSSPRRSSSSRSCRGRAAARSCAAWRAPPTSARTRATCRRWRTRSRSRRSAPIRRREPIRCSTLPVAGSQPARDLADHPGLDPSSSPAPIDDFDADMAAALTYLVATWGGSPSDYTLTVSSIATVPNSGESSGRPSSGRTGGPDPRGLQEPPGEVGGNELWKEP